MSGFNWTIQENASDLTVTESTVTMTIAETVVSIGGGGGGATNLSYTASPTNGTVNSDTGTDATLPLGTGTNAGLLSPAQFTKLSNLSGTNTGDQTSIVGITGTKSQFDTAVTDGNFMYVGDAPTAHTHPQSEITNLVSDLAAKSPIASPTFTGTVTTPAIVLSSETASRLAILDASKNIKSADTTTYPSLTELAYVKGVTSAIQTQLDAKVAKAPALQSVTSSATVTPNADEDDVVVITAQAAGLTLANPSGTPAQGQALIIRIKDNGTSRSITYGSQYRAIGVTLPTATTVSKTIYLGCIYNATDTKWDVVGYQLEA